MENQTLINQILALFKKYQNQPLEYFLIAKIEVFLPVKIQKGIKFRQISSQNTAQIIDFITENQAIKITLIHKTLTNQLIENNNYSIDNQLFIKLFSKKELDYFLQIANDKNPVHYTSNPIVPGLLILENILESQIPSPKYFSIKFNNPLFLQNELKVHQLVDNELIGEANNIPIFHFKKTIN